MKQNHSSKVIHSIARQSTPLLGCLLLAAVVAGCSSVKTHVNEATIRANTFSFLDPGPRQSPDYAENRKEAHDMVQQALKNTLASKGVSYVASGGEVTVAYLIIVGNNGATTSLNNYFGYSADSVALVEKVHSQETGNDQNRAYFEAGTLVVDFVDPHTSKLLQRRSAQAQLLRNLPQEQRIARLQGVVDETLKDVVISH
jgi:hypothetical protein